MAAVSELLSHMTSLTPSEAIAETLGRRLADVESAIDQLDQRLRRCGLSVHRLKNEVAIRPAGHLDADRLRDATRPRFARSGMNITEARVLPGRLPARWMKPSSERRPGCLGSARNGGLISEDGVAGIE